MRFAYADPPYVGQAKRLYGRHPDYAGEVDHQALIDRLENSGEFDGWGLSCSMKSLPLLLGWCPSSVLVLAWHKPTAPPMGDNRIYSWEPVILRPLRKPATPTRTSLVCSPPLWTFREAPPEHVTGEKPEQFAVWLFASAAMRPDDEFVDLFPGSGAVGRAWEKWSMSLDRETIA